MGRRAKRILANSFSMSLSFEHRRDAVHEGILSGSIGCPFAQRAAQQGEIAYCPSPDTINAAKPNMPYITAIHEFAYDKAKSVLIALPEKQDMVTEDEARLYSKQLFPETVSSMRFATRDMLDLLLSENNEDDVDLYEILDANPVLDRQVIFDFWKANATNLRNSMPSGGMVTPHLLRHKTRIVEPIFSFTMDPSYKPLQSLPHPRHSPHFALIINYRNDLQKLADTDPKTFAATRQWMKAAVGYPYSQGYRISQTPLVVTDEEPSSHWKPID